MATKKDNEIKAMFNQKIQRWDKRKDTTLG